MILPEFSLDGKVALVTGGGRGLGLEIAKALASYGALVLVNGRNYENLIGAVETINSNSIEGSALPLQFDVSDDQQFKKHSVKSEKNMGDWIFLSIMLECAIAEVCLNLRWMQYVG